MAKQGLTTISDFLKTKTFLNSSIITARSFSSTIQLSRKFNLANLVCIEEFKSVCQAVQDGIIFQTEQLQMFPSNEIAKPCPLTPCKINACNFKWDAPLLQKN